MSNISTSLINVNYPKPKVNNNSQGFRDNFSAIKGALNVTNSELTDLENKSLFKSGTSNDMANTLIKNASTLGFKKKVHNLGTLNGQVTVEISNGNVQVGTLGGNVVFKLVKWPPAGTYGELNLIIKLTNPSFAQSTIQFPAANMAINSLKSIENYSSTTNNITFPANCTELHFKLISENCGNSIDIQSVNRPSKFNQIQTKDDFNAIGLIGDKRGDVRVDENYIYICSADYNGSNTIWKKITLASY
jgi:hypothetical protein